MSLQFLTITMRNFMSFGNVPTTVDLSVPGSTLIIGKNLEVSPEGTASNGSGKSTVIQAIVYALYDKPISNISKDGLVNIINGKHMEVSLIFKTQGMYYKIVRARKMKAGAYGNWVKLYEREENADFTDADEVTNTVPNKEIEDKIGIPYELFIRMIVFSGSGTQFLSLPAKHPTQPCQQSFIEELFDLKLLTQKAEILKAQVKEHETEFLILQNRVAATEREHALYDQRLAEAVTSRDAWQSNTKKQIDSLKKSLKKIEGIDLEQQQALQQAVEDLEQAMRSKMSEQNDLNRALKQINSHVDKLCEEKDHLSDDTCPYCKQNYHDEEKLSSVVSDISLLDAEKVKILAELQVLTDDIAELKTELQDQKGMMEFDDLEELLTIKFKQTEIMAKIAELSTSNNPYISMVEMIERQRPEDIDMDSLNELNNTIEHERFLIKLLTKNDSFIRKALLNKNLPFLNSRLNYYLRRIELPHIVEFTHDLTPRITRFGSEFDFDNLSTGQKARVNIALALSFRDVLQNLHQKINLFCIDESLDMGLDSMGVVSVAKILKEEARKSGTCLFVISHREEISTSFDRKLFVIYENGFSTIQHNEEIEDVIEEAA